MKKVYVRDWNLGPMVGWLIFHSARNGSRRQLLAIAKGAKDMAEREEFDYRRY
jgi:hypothetical protein